MENKKTAVQWLKKEVQMNRFYTLKGRREAFEKAIQMEKEQIMKAYKDYHNLGHIYGLESEQYYNETYNK